MKNYSGIETDGWAYDAHCLVGTLELEPSPLDTNTIAWQRFLPVGPVGFLPVRFCSSLRYRTNLKTVLPKDCRYVWLVGLVDETADCRRTEEVGRRTSDCIDKCLIPATMVLVTVAVPAPANITGYLA